MGGEGGADRFDSRVGGAQRVQAWTRRAPSPPTPSLQSCHGNCTRTPVLSKGGSYPPGCTGSLDRRPDAKVFLESLGTTCSVAKRVQGRQRRVDARARPRECYTCGATHPAGPGPDKSCRLFAGRFCKENKKQRSEFRQITKSKGLPREQVSFKTSANIMLTSVTSVTRRASTSHLACSNQMMGIARESR